MNTRSKVSIGICTSNDEMTIGRVLRNFLKNDYMKNDSIEISEIIVVSSGSIDNTNKIVTNYQRMHPNKIQVILEKNRNGKSSAQNIIFQKYKGDFLILLPADVKTFRKSIDYLVKYLLNEPLVGVVSGQPLINHQHNNCDFVCKVGSILWNLHNLNLSKLNIGANNHATGELMALRKGIIEKIPENIINDDAYISIVARQKGWLIGYEPKALVYITTPSRLIDYFIQRKRVVMGHKQLKSIRKTQSTTSKSLFFQKPFFVIPLVLTSLKGYGNIFYFLVALIIEIYIETLFTLRISNIQQTSNIWKRIRAKRIP